MRIVKLKNENRCEMPLCGNLTYYAIVSNGMRGKSIPVCRNCIERLYEECGKLIVPKGLENMIERANKRRKIYE